MQLFIQARPLPAKEDTIFPNVTVIGPMGCAQDYSR